MSFHLQVLPALGFMDWAFSMKNAACSLRTDGPWIDEGVGVESEHGGAAERV